MTSIASKEYFPIEGWGFDAKSGRWKARIENDPDDNAAGDLRVFQLRFDLVEPHKSWSGEKVRKLELTTSRAGLVTEKLGNFLLQVVEGFLLDEKPKAEKTCFGQR